MNSKSKSIRNGPSTSFSHSVKSSCVCVCISISKCILGGDDRFVVEKDTGWIKTTGLPLVKDREYLLTVLAADKLGNKGSPASISVIAGLRPPQFTNISYVANVPEDFPQGKV